MGVATLLTASFTELAFNYKSVIGGLYDSFKVCVWWVRLACAIPVECLCLRNEYSPVQARLHAFCSRWRKHDWQCTAWTGCVRACSPHTARTILQVMAYAMKHAGGGGGYVLCTCAET